MSYTVCFLCVLGFGFVRALFTDTVESQFIQENGTSDLVGITILQDAKKIGAVCLDGSPPAYHLRRGFGSGTSKWHIHLQGGGWCESALACSKRAQTSLGSSLYMSNQLFFGGILSNNQNINPDFYNWNHVYVRYCDGASFTGDVAERSSGQTLLYFRGLRIFGAVVEHLNGLGLKNSNQALLSGCSAGGLAVVHRCNQFQSLLAGVSVKCLSDAGFFLDVPNTKGAYDFHNYLKNVVSLQKLYNTLPSSCTSAKGKDVTKCFFPQDAQAYVQPPLFFVNSAYDYWQLEHIKELSRSQYNPCTRSSNCSQIQELQGFRKGLLNNLSFTKSRSSWGTFIDSCFIHCQTEQDDRWTQSKIHGKSVADAVGDWYFGREAAEQSHRIDCSYPSCNPTCSA